MFVSLDFSTNIVPADSKILFVSHQLAAKGGGEVL
jgi:hypothetical protein